MKNRKIIYHLGRLSEKKQWKMDFKDGRARSVSERIELGFINLKIPIIDAVPYRIFKTLKDYRSWANKNLPEWLGYYTHD